MVNLANREKELTNFHLTLEPAKKQQLLQNKLSNNIWSYAGTSNKKTKLPDFLEILIVFIKKTKHKARENPRKNRTNFL